MDRTTLLATAEKCMDLAKDNLLPHGCVAFATLVILRGNTSIVPIMLEDSSPEPTERLSELLRTMAPHTAATFVISGAWTAEAPTTEVTLPVSQHPDRKEGVFVVASSPLSRAVTARWAGASPGYSNFQNIYARACE